VILDACGNIDAAACGLQSAAVEEIQAATNRIYEACTFQDITGQRINKIVATLCTIEERIAVLLTAANRPGRSLGTGIQQAGACNRSEDGRALLNGPQLPDAAPNQEDVDALFAASG
jgi:chemotaxis protein CheZ